MKLFIDSDDYFSFLEQVVKTKPKEVFIATYGLWAGIRANGDDMRTWEKWESKYKLRTREMLELMRGLPNVRIMVGLYEYKSCKKAGCVDCERKYASDIIRHVAHADTFPEFQWRLASSSHVKCVLFKLSNDKIIGTAGSRNFTDSSWDDISFGLGSKDAAALTTYCNGLWDKAEVLNNDCLATVFAKQKISQEALDTIGDL